MKVELLLTLISVPVVGGVAATWFYARRREREAIAMRLDRLIPESAEPSEPVILLKKQELATLAANRETPRVLPGLSAFKSLVTEAALADHLASLATLTVVLLAAPLVAAICLNLNLVMGGLAGLVAAGILIISVKIRGESRRNKFSEQLPDAIDLMVAVLRSGHSIAQAVKSVSAEIANPCGEEFEAILHRVNLGQTLAESLSYSAKRFRSYELDLIRRAAAIQIEVGGSLAELLDKTNQTLRQRLKLARQLKTITAQSRLSAQIVGLLPIVLAIGLNALSPGYLQLLIQDKIGQLLVCAAIVLEVVGLVIMQRMSTMRV